MAGRNVLARIDDMLGAIEVIEGINLDATGIEAKWMRYAWERAFEVLSEASRHLPEDLKASEPEVAWRQIASLGNVLRHDYQSINEDILERASVLHLPGLRDALLRFRERLG